MSVQKLLSQPQLSSILVTSFEKIVQYEKQDTALGIEYTYRYHRPYCEAQSVSL